MPAPAAFPSVLPTNPGLQNGVGFQVVDPTSYPGSTWVEASSAFSPAPAWIFPAWVFCERLGNLHQGLLDPEVRLRRIHRIESSHLEPWSHSSVHEGSLTGLPILAEAVDITVNIRTFRRVMGVNLGRYHLPPRPL